MIVKIERGMIWVQIVYGLILLIASTGLFCCFLIDDYRFGNFVNNCVAFLVLLIFLHALTNLVDGIVRLKGHKKFWKLTMIPLFIMEDYVDGSPLRFRCLRLNWL